MENNVTLSRNEMSMVAYALQCLADERKRNHRSYRDVLDLKCRITDCLMGGAVETEQRVPSGRC